MGYDRPMSKRTPHSHGTPDPLAPIRVRSVRARLAVAVPIALVVSVTALAAAAVSRAGDECPAFDVPLVLDAGIGTWWIEPHDFDRDGHLDLGVTAEGSDAFIVMPGHGDGTFTPLDGAIVTPAGNFPREFAIADLDGDGIDDVVVANTFASSDSLVVLIGDGAAGTWAGSFRPDVIRGVGPNPTALATGDVDGDTRVDLVVTARDTDELVVLLGTGDGSLVTPRERIPTGDGPAAVALLHADADEHLDAIVVCGTDRVCQVFLATGDGTSFTLDASYDVGVTPVGVVAGRFDADDVPDLAIANASSNDVAILLAVTDGGQPTGTYAPAVFYTVGDGSDVSPGFLATADLTGDGFLDIVTPNSHDDDLSVLVGLGDGTFAPARSFPLGQYPRAAAIADLDRDLRPDVVVTDYFDGSVSVLLNACELVPVQTSGFRAERLGDRRVRLSWYAAGDGCPGFRVVAGARTGDRVVAEVLCGGQAIGDRYEVVDERAETGRIRYRLHGIGRDEPRALASAIAPAVSGATSPPAPNPTGGAVRIDAALAENVEARLDVHDAAGRLVRRVTVRPDRAGAVSWDGALASGAPAPPGVYWVVVDAGSSRRTWRVTVAR